MLGVVDEAEAGFGAFGEDDEAAVGGEVGAADFGVAGDGDGEVVGEAAEVGRRRDEGLVAEDAEGFGGEFVFGDAVEVVEGGLGGPADVVGAVDVGLGPVEDAAEFVPVGDLFEGQEFDGGAGDDEAVEAVVADLLPGEVEGEQVLHGGVAGDVVGDAHEGEFDLEGGSSDEAGELGLGSDLIGHEVEEADAEGADILADGIGFAHDHDAFGFEDAAGGEVIRDTNGHAQFLPRGAGVEGISGDPIGCQIGHILPMGAPPCPESRLALGIAPTLDARRREGGSQRFHRSIAGAGAGVGAYGGIRGKTVCAPRFDSRATRRRSDTAG